MLDENVLTDETSTRENITARLFYVAYRLRERFMDSI